MAKRRAGSAPTAAKKAAKKAEAARSKTTEDKGAKGNADGGRAAAARESKAAAVESSGARAPRGKAARPSRAKTAFGRTIPVVAVGASAGGLEAFTQLLSALPADTGMAYVLVSHLSHTHKSMLSELLGKATAMPVIQVGRRVIVRPNHVYLIPPQMDLSVDDGVISASPLSERLRPHMVIDHFMRSLAEQRRNRSIGVVLSGSGSDGTLGLAAIKAEGGVTFTQDEGSARYADMPRSAWEAGAADFRLPPDQIAAELARISRHPYVAQHPRSAVEGPADAPPRELGTIFSLVRAATGVDFSFYKPTTIRRRISRRMMVHKIGSTPEYIALLRANREEIEALFQDLLISVTGFFRDHEVFDTLTNEYIRTQFAKRSSDAAVRVWVPGCATGEEAYSIAICLIEALGGGANPPVQVFGTDVSEAAIKRARAGHYSENIRGDVSPERLRNYFVRTESGYQIAPRVRDVCVFANQNLVNDPPFSRLDLISCRNLLIYLGPEMQKRVLATFHYALKPGGLLVLGTSETVGGASQQFQTENKKYRIYSKIHGETPAHFEYAPHDPEPERRGPARQAGNAAVPSIDLNRDVEKLLLKRYAPAGVVINRALDIVHFRGQTSPFLEPAPGQASLNLLRMAREGLRAELRSVIQQAQRTSRPARKERIRLRGGGDGAINIEVIPMPRRGEADMCYAVLFEAAAPSHRAPEASRPASSATPRNADAGEVAALREELATVQDDLNSIIEEQEASNEELQSANEEILSSNEELQSTNEELETAKEELQATNEELNTVNDELQTRNSELSQTNNDLINLLTAVDIVIVMLSQNLRIRRFTPSAQRIMNLIAGDVGRPLRDINTRLRRPGLENMIAEVIDTMTVKEEEIQDESGRWYSLRVRPYRTVDNKIDGAVLILVEIDVLKRIAQRLHMLSRVFQAASDPILVQDLGGKIVEINDACARTYGWTRDELLGKPATVLIPPEHHERAAALLERCANTEDIHEEESVRWTRDRKRLPVLVSLSLITEDNGQPIAIATLTKQHRAPETS